MSRIARHSNTRFSVIFSLTALLTLFATAGSVRAQAPGRAVADLAQDANRAFGLARSDVVRLEVGKDARGRVSVPVQINGAADELSLLPHSVRSPFHQVLAQVADGSYVEVPAGPVRTYRGELRNTPGSVVAATLLENGFEARIILPNGNELWIEPLAGRIPGAQAGQHVVYRGEDILPGDGTCLALAVAGADAGAGTTASASEPAAATALQQALLATDADYEYFVRWGSVSGVQTRIESVINAMNIQYERDVAITHLLGTMVVRTAEPDPYSSTDAQTLLNQFRNEWNLNQRSVPRDTAHLFTGKTIDGSTIGIAWVGVICQPTSGSGYGYGLSQSDFNNNFGYATDLTAHELGHNWNASHCTCTTYTMNPYITGANQFNPVGTIPTITSFRDSRTCLDPVSTNPPAAPTGLSATATSSSAISLSWTDNASDELGFDVERSPDGNTWSLRTSLGADATSYNDSGLSANTTYHYRVRAYNGSGNSDYSNTASATTENPPPFVIQVASADLPASGSVNGNYTATWTDDGLTQDLTEVESGGKPSNRTSYLEHAWQLSVQAGAAVTVFVDAWGGSSEDSFRFEVSTNGGASYSPMFVVAHTDTGDLQSHSLPASTSGTVLVRVVDTDRTSSRRTLDTVHVDEIFIRTDFVPGTPPLAPSNLQVTSTTSSQVSLSWADNASDEYGFELERSVGGGAWSSLATLGANVTAYDDLAVLPLTAYSYRVRAYNGSGNSSYSNTTGTTTPDGPVGINLQSATGYKVKAIQHVDLVWSGGSGGTVIIRRDGVTIATVPNNGGYTDNIGQKGSGTYTYQVCEPGPTNCSDTRNVVF